VAPGKPELPQVEAACIAVVGVLLLRADNWAAAVAVPAVLAADDHQDTHHHQEMESAVAAVAVAAAVAPLCNSLVVESFASAQRWQIQKTAALVVERMHLQQTHFVVGLAQPPP
jgi:hypothetical protein